MLLGGLSERAKLLLWSGAVFSVLCMLGMLHRAL